MPPRKLPLKVRGVCAAGHVVEAEAEPGRVTWRGQCTTEGCTRTVVAKRIRDAAALPKQTPPAPPAAPAAETKPAGKPRRKVVRDGDYGGPTASQRPAGVRADDAGGSPAGGDGDEHDYRDAGDAGRGAGEPATGGRAGKRAAAKPAVPAQRGPVDERGDQPRRRGATPWDHLY